MSKIKKFFQNDEIKLSFGLGFCIILLAFVFKRILQVELGYLENAAPGIVFLIYEGLKERKVDRKYLRPLYWNLGMIAVSVAIILFHLDEMP